MKTNEIRQRFLAFFEKRGHRIVPSASLLPENDPSVLFTTAGMQPLVPYLLGEHHPGGSRIADVQKCVRTNDIDEVGDNTHLTFFEMLGNWSLGDYFKKEAIEWSYTFLTSKDEGFGLDPHRLYVTVFEGNTDVEKDTEAVSYWKEMGVPESRIYFRGVDDNWWKAGSSGPSGPSSEMYYDVTEKGLGDMTPEEFANADERQDVVEIWNDVFMEYEMKDGAVIGKLPHKNIDTGAGLERVCAVVQGVSSVFETDLLKEIVTYATAYAGEVRRARIIADHMRSALFLIGDGVVPANTNQGYILRRLIRRAVFNTDKKQFTPEEIHTFISHIIDLYMDAYSDLDEKRMIIIEEIQKEVERFDKTLSRGLKEFEKLASSQISGHDAFILFSTYGFPFEMTKELAREKGIAVDENGFRIEFEKHQEDSRTAGAGMFKGGLAGTGEIEMKYHTATHLLHQALRDVLGEHVQQKGSNITAERLRFDFSHTAKMTDEEKQKVEEIVNKKIQEDLLMQKVVLPREEAEKSGALHFFGDKYGDEVSVYYIGDSLENAYSKEFCGGPHVTHTGVLGHFKIKKEESVSTGVRRIKAVLE